MLMNLNTVHVQRLPGFQTWPKPFPSAVYWTYPLDHLIMPHAHLPEAELLVLPNPPAPSFQLLGPKTLTLFPSQDSSMYKYHWLCLPPNPTSTLFCPLPQLPPWSSHHLPPGLQQFCLFTGLPACTPAPDGLFSTRASRLQLKFMSVMLQERSLPQSTACRTIHLYEMSKTGKSTEAESRLVVAQGWVEMGG